MAIGRMSTYTVGIETIRENKALRQRDHDARLSVQVTVHFTRKRLYDAGEIGTATRYKTDDKKSVSEQICAKQLLDLSREVE